MNNVISSEENKTWAQESGGSCLHFDGALSEDEKGLGKSVQMEATAFLIIKKQSRGAWCVQKIESKK